MTETRELLAQFVATRSGAAFRELTDRYVNLVFSTAYRLVSNNRHLAEDATQVVFTDLARMAGGLSKDVMLGGWLHRHTCYVCSKMMRSERRRRERENKAAEMNIAEDRSTEFFTQFAPILDEAVDSLRADDRAAVLMRFFEQRDYHDVATALGTSEEAARKRVDRSLVKLRAALLARGVAIPGAVLATALPAGAVTSAPAGLAASVAGAALTAGAATGTTVSILQFMSATKLKIGIAATLIAAGVGIPWFQQIKTASRLSASEESVRQLTTTNRRLELENFRLTNAAILAGRAAARADVSPAAPTTTLDAAADGAVPVPAAGTSEIEKMKSDAAGWKGLRDQQKLAMTQIYSNLANQLGLTPDMTEKFYDLLADNLMGSIDEIVMGLRLGTPLSEMDPIFDRRQAGLNEKLQTLIGPDAADRFQTYTRNGLAAEVMAFQFASALSGDPGPDKLARRLAFRDLVSDELAQARVRENLPENYQAYPSLNLRNVLSETEAEKSLGLLDEALARAMSRAGTGLVTPDELAKMNSIRETVISNQRNNLTMNRKLMSPAGPAR